jgi:biotin carboxyl carrier protein
MSYTITVNGKKFDVEIGRIVNGRTRATVNKITYEVTVESFETSAPRIPPTPVVPVKPSPSPVKQSDPGAALLSDSGVLFAPIPGVILELKVKKGDKVEAGQVVAIMEAMKMENNLIAPIDGTVRDILVEKGKEVSTGAVIMRIE